jgi:hypothetical protein
MTAILKILFSSTTLATCWYGVNIFGLSMWPILFSALSVFILMSLLFPKLNVVAVVIARIMGILSLTAFALLLLASTVGGSSHMSESNQIIAVALATMAFLGCAFFLVKKTNAAT